ncbi:unnamed protein product [Arabidopsis thaliana]|uniref:Uncharacterized protein n=1 Tax=Arabidopsis thaliana TaxID=3702 RepID=A0A5S9Y686_ARATH|nr:unnamed protein product [Arabidopsis thaliana]
MSIRCFSCFKFMFSKKKQSKKGNKPLKAERLLEPVKKREDAKDKKRPPMQESKSYSYWSSSHVGSNDVEPNVNELYGPDVISSSVNNDFNKVKTFGIRGVTEVAAK